MGSGTSPSTPSKSQGSAFDFLPFPPAGPFPPMTPGKLVITVRSKYHARPQTWRKWFFGRKNKERKSRKLTEEVGKVGSNKKTNPALITNN